MLEHAQDEARTAAARRERARIHQQVARDVRAVKTAGENARDRSRFVTARLT
jgi:hypothetical protein